MQTALAAMAALVISGTSLLSLAQAADLAGVGEKKNYTVAAGTLSKALSSFAGQAGVTVSFEPAITEGLSAKGLNGSYGLKEGFEQILQGSGLEAVPAANGNWMLRKASLTKPAAGAAPQQLAEVSVHALNAQPLETATGHVQGYVAKRSATGTKTDAPIIEAPQSMSVVTADFIEATGATRLKDALAYTPGVNVSPWGADSRFDWMILRGFDAQTPGYYLDGLQMRNNNSWAIWQTENYGTERVEILRGPASVLYGQNSAGGMVNIVSKRPTEQPLHELQLQVGDHSRKQVAGDFSGPLNQDGTVLYRITGLVRDAELPNSGLPNDRSYIAPALTWKPSDATTLTLLSHYLRTRSGSSYTNVPEAGSLLPNPNGRISPSTYLGEPGFDRFDQNQWMVGYLFEHRFNDTWIVRQNARYGRTKVNYDQLFTNGFTTVNSADATDPANFRLVERYPFGSKERAALFAIDNQAQASLQLGSWQHTLLFGLDYQRTRSDQRTYNSGSVAAIDAYDPVYTGSVETADPWFDAVTRLKQTGVYMQDQIKWGDWVATLGGRYDRASSDTESKLDGSSANINEHRFSSRAGLVYLHPSGWAPYFSYAESFMPTATLDSNGQPLQPETGRQYEAGIRFQPPGRKALYSAAVFDLRRQNYITFDPTAGYAPKQTGEVLVRGLELEAKLQPLDRLNLVAAYSYTPKAEVTASIVADDIGKQLQAVSENQLALWADYRFSNQIKVGLGARYMGSTHGYAETASAKIAAYTLYDALLGYDFGQWSLALNARNLTDKTYVANCSYGSCYYGEPRRAMATLTYRW